MQEYKHKKLTTVNINKVYAPTGALKIKRFWHKRYEWECDLEIKKKYPIKSCKVKLEKIK